MAKSSLPREPRIYFALVVLFFVLLLFMPRSGKFNYNYKKGSPWAYESLVSQFDFPILKTAAQLEEEREAASSSVVPYFNWSEKEALSVERAVKSLPFEGAGDIKSKVVSSIEAIYNRGVMADNAAESAGNSDIIFVHKDKRAQKTPVEEVYTLSTARSRIVSDVSKSVKGVDVDSLLSANGVFNALVPNLSYDKESTDLVHAQTGDYISPTQGFVSAGQTIVSKDELVTAEILQMLDSYKSEYENNLGYSGPRVRLLAGNAIMALVLVLILFLSIVYTNPNIFSDLNRFYYLVFIFAIAAVMAMLFERVNPKSLYMVPFTVTALFLRAFFKKRVVLPVYVISLVPMLVFAHDGVQLFVMFLVAGVVTIYVFDYFNRGWRQFITAVIAFLVLSLTFMAFLFINDVRGAGQLQKIIYLFFGSMFTVAFYPLIYLFEKLFGLVSKSRLQELCDTGNPMLTMMAQKAPGTFQHSLQVMNMADAVAKRLDANVDLVRAGALYHDIGKTGNPQCFIENQTMGSDYHAGLTPKESASQILRHVTYGMELAEKAHLPKIVSEFILTHHGTSCTAYFYNKFLNEGGDPSQRDDFCYKGKKPTMKEQIILMVCDTVEAASRTVKDNNPGTYDKLVESLVQGKINDGQFDEADISLKELGEMKAVIKEYLRQLYHERIVYPEASK